MKIKYRNLTFVIIGVLALSVLLKNTILQNRVGRSNGQSAPRVKDLLIGSGGYAVKDEFAKVHYRVYIYDEYKPQGRGELLGTFNKLLEMGRSRYLVLENAVSGMRVGGVRQVIIPSFLGKEFAEDVEIPEDGFLLFEVALADLDSHRKQYGEGGL